MLNLLDVNVHLIRNESSNGGTSPATAVSRLSDREIGCQLLWKLARSHGWARWIPEDDLVRTLPRSDRRRARREVLPALGGDSRTVFQRGRGFKLDHEGIETLAYYLRDRCGYSELRIEATLSHFDGF